MTVSKGDTSFLENQKFMRETIKNQEVDFIKNPILKRCVEKTAEKDLDPNKDVHQSYDRMYHRHSRS